MPEPDISFLIVLIDISFQIRIGFHACVWIFAVKTVKDTQCGFKVPESFYQSSSFSPLNIGSNSKSFQLLKRRTAEVLFNTLHIERWAFDVEMLKVNIMLATIECPTQGYNLHLTETKFKGCGNAANTTGGSFS